MTEDRAKDRFIRRIDDLRRRGAATASASCRPRPYPVPIVVDRELGLLLRLAYARRDDRAMIIPDCFPV